MAISMFSLTMYATGCYHLSVFPVSFGERREETHELHIDKVIPQPHHGDDEDVHREGHEYDLGVETDELLVLFQLCASN